jgi:hypothetical protein
MLGRIRRNAENVTINGTGIQGLTSVQVGYDSAGASPLSNLGINSIEYAPQGPQTANLQLNTLLTHTLSPSAHVTSSEVLENFTGAAAFSGVVGYGSKNIIFTEAYMETYTVSCGIGEIPAISTSSTIFGDFGTGSLGPVPVDSYPSTVNIASYNSMEVNLDEFNSNRMLSFSVEIATPRVPLYAVGLDVPTGIIAGTPIEVNVNFVLDVDDYEIKNMRFVPEQTVFKNTIITLNKNNSQTKLLEYSFDDMLLTSESFQASDQGNAGVNFNLRSFILR